MHHFARKSQTVGWRRAGFTLIELLVVITVILILMTFTVAAVNFTLDAERVSGATGQVQSFLQGARDRAIQANAPRGVRFFTDTTITSGMPPIKIDADLVTTMAYIAPGQLWGEGTFRMQRTATSPTLANVVAGSSNTGWWELKKRGMLYNGLRVKIPNSRSGSWYTINVDAIDTTTAYPPAFTTSNPFPLLITISPPFRDPATNRASNAIAFADGGPTTYAIELPPTVVPREPGILPTNTVIDLIGSKFPGHPSESWLDTSVSPSKVRNAQLPYFDIMFSSRGTVMGTAASSGTVHFYVGDLTGAEKVRDHIASLTEAQQDELDGIQLIASDNFTMDGSGVGDRRIVTLFTQTGAVSTHAVNPTDADTSGDAHYGFADDPFLFAERGEDAN